MRIPRRLFVATDSLMHVVWKCHNNSHFLTSSKVKEKLLELYFTYKKDYGIKIYGFTIMNNHLHVLMMASDATNLGNYMRRVNSQLAVFINKTFNKDSQAIKSRYKSPVIKTHKYLIVVLAYILLNRFKADLKTHPQNDPGNSIYHLKHNTKYGKMLDPISELGICNVGEELIFLKKLIKHFMQKILSDVKYFAKTYCFQHQFVIGCLKTLEQARAEIKAQLNKIYTKQESS